MGAAMVSFAPSRLPATQVESIPVNIVTDTSTSEMTKGMTTAPKESQKPFVEKIDQPNAVDNPAAKIAPKEVTASTDVTPPPEAPEPKREETKKKAGPKRDLIAEALKKDDAKKSEQKKADAKIPTPPKRPPMPQAKPQPKFDPREMAALLDKRDPQRKQATGDTLSDAPALGTARGSAPKLTQNELDALRRRLIELWSPPIATTKNLKELVVVVQIRLNPDGTLAAPPRVITSGQSPQFIASRDSAMRAVFRGQPFTMLRPETYEDWKFLEVEFDPELVNG